MLNLLRVTPTGLLLPGQMTANVAGLRIDWTHPIAAGLQACMIAGPGGVLVDLAKPRMAVGGTTGLRLRGPTVAALTMTAAQTPDLNFTAAPFTYACVAYMTIVPPGNAVTVWGRFNYVDETNNQGWAILNISTTDYQVWLFNNNGAANYTLSTGVAPTVGEHTIGCTTDGVVRRAYVDGVQTASSSGVNLISASAPASTLYCPKATDNLWELHIGCAWSRALSAAEMLQFHTDPFCFLQSVDFMMPVLSAPAAPATSKLFIPSSLNGLGAGGPFFHNRLG